MIALSARVWRINRPGTIPFSFTFLSFVIPPCLDFNQIGESDYFPSSINVVRISVSHRDMCSILIARTHAKYIRLI